MESLHRHHGRPISPEKNSWGTRRKDPEDASRTLPQQNFFLFQYLPFPHIKNRFSLFRHHEKIKNQKPIVFIPMASSLALKRLIAANLLPKTASSLRPVAAAPSASRLFNTGSLQRQYDSEDDRDVDVDRRSGRPLPRRRDDFFSDVFDPFSSPTRSLSQVLNLVDQMMENPFLASRGVGAGIRRGYDVKETEDALNLRIDMPGLSKEEVKVSVEQNTLVIRGEGEKESEDEESGRKYTSRLDLPEKAYKLDEIKAEMKNGVLKVVVPKVKEEERNDVYQINVE